MNNKYLNKFSKILIFENILYFKLITISELAEIVYKCNAEPFFTVDLLKKLSLYTEIIIEKPDSWTLMF